MRVHATFEGNVEYTPEEELEADILEAEYLASLSVIQVPKTITMAQCREQLICIGLDDEVEAILNAIPDLVKQKIYRNGWEYETIVKIDNPMLLELAPLLSIDLDNFFIEANKL
ncbi:MAG: hypothetical protein NTW78_03900 [Campylobacterales bacterium]|nr:hypothetical protein [Campylobacterales bacterium]